MEHESYFEISHVLLYRLVNMYETFCYNRFEIAFQTLSGLQILHAKATPDTFLLTGQLENGSWVLTEKTTTYPFYDFKEYNIVFEVLTEYWQVVEKLNIIVLTLKCIVLYLIT